MQRLILWDVDGTLVRTGGAGAEVFIAAIERALGVSAHDHGVRMSGKTDPQIAREILAAVAETATLSGAELDDAIVAVMGHIERELAGAVERIRQEGRVLPGVREVLAALHDDPDVLQSLLTGNIAPNAMVKVAAFDLDGYFDWDVGAFGSDHHDRIELVPVAVEKAADRHGRRFGPEEVWIVGDTPRDLACARAAGASCLLVATGRYAVDELTTAVDEDRGDGAGVPEGVGATDRREHVLPDLADVDAVLTLLRA